MQTLVWVATLLWVIDDIKRCVRERSATCGVLLVLHRKWLECNLISAPITESINNTETLQQLHLTQSNLMVLMYIYLFSFMWLDAWVGVGGIVQ